jgi:hypothetical protein
LLTENFPEQRFLQALFLEETQRGLVAVSSYLLPDTAIAAAELNLLQYPKRPIALVLNAGPVTAEDVERKRAAISRILSRITRENRHIALAVANVDDWIMTDSRIRTSFDSDPTTRDNRYERAARIGGLVAAQPLNREEIGRAIPEFQALAEFIAQKTHVPQATA